ncbi:MAG: hypothetical protein IKP28_06590 [Clostridia bacterium]|nr:hypothetical protein [Clostridia bacterium]
MKNNRLAKFLIILLALTMVVIILVAGTYAKYTSTATGTASAKVAKWSIELAGTEIATATPQTVTIDLFETILDSDLTSAEQNVAANATDHLIAPGTSGQFSLTIENKSEVDAEYTLDATVTNDDDIPIEFKVNDGAWVTSLDGLDTSSATGLNMGATDTITIQWRWAFTGAGSTNYQTNQTNTTDTALGIAARTARPEVSVEIAVVASQVD